MLWARSCTYTYSTRLMGLQSLFSLYTFNAMERSESKLRCKDRMREKYARMFAAPNRELKLYNFNYILIKLPLVREEGRGRRCSKDLESEICYSGPFQCESIKFSFIFP